MSAQWVESVEQLNGNLVAIRNGLAEGADLLRAQSQAKVVCDSLEHEGHVIGREPGKLLCQGWEARWEECADVLDGAFGSLPSSAGLTRRQSKLLHQAVTAIVKFLQDGTNDYSRRKLAANAAEAINSYLHEAGQTTIEASNVVTTEPNPAPRTPHANPIGWEACPDIAKREGLPLEALDARLRRFRSKSVAGRDWREDDPTSRTVRSSTYIYRLQSIQTIIDKMKSDLRERR